MEKKLLNCLATFDVLDLLGFARIVGVEEQDDFEQYIIDIVQKFTSFPKDKKKELLRLAQDVSGWNKSVDQYNKGEK